MNDTSWHDGTFDWTDYMSDCFECESLNDDEWDESIDHIRNGDLV